MGIILPRRLARGALLGHMCRVAKRVVVTRLSVLLARLMPITMPRPRVSHAQALGCSSHQTPVATVLASLASLAQMTAIRLLPPLVFLAQLALISALRASLARVRITNAVLAQATSTAIQSRDALFVHRARTFQPAALVSELSGMRVLYFPLHFRTLCLTFFNRPLLRLYLPCWQH